MKIARFFLLFFWASSTLCASTLLPELNREDVHQTLKEIMESHVSYKKLSPALVQRAIEEYLHILDPFKTYFLSSETEVWLNLSEGEREQLAQAIDKKDFSLFFKMHQKMVQAISRRNVLEKKLQGALVDIGKRPKVRVKDLKWAENEEMLLERLQYIKSLQIKAISQLSDESQEKAFKRLLKQRTHKENQIVEAQKEELERCVFSHILKAFAASFDAHTAYFTPREASQFLFQVQQRLFGIGAVLKDNLDGFVIAKIVEGGPASRSLLKENDRIIAIEKEPVVGMDLYEVVEMIRGQANSPVLLTLIRENGQEEQRLEITIMRGEVIIQEARFSAELIPFGEGVIAHLCLHSFYQDPQSSSAEDIKKSLLEIMKKEELKGVILDLRENSGGVLPQAVSVTGLFIQRGIVVSIKDSSGRVDHLRETQAKSVWGGPLIVLTSKMSASAAEIVAQALQDYGRALVIGDQHTYGKGTFQTLTLDTMQEQRVNPKGELKVTRGRYYTVSGKSPQFVGVTPDIILPGCLCEMEVGERYTKYPLENDSISSQFNDTLLDIHPMQRERMAWLYRAHLQPKLTLYTKHLPTLRSNVEKRLASHSLYQDFLKELREMKESEEEVESPLLKFSEKADFQLTSTIEVMKDLILLCMEKSS